MRDAGVSLLGLFKIILLRSTDVDASFLVNDVIKNLPKARQNEINKRIELF